MKKIFSFIIVITMIVSTFSLTSFAAEPIRTPIKALVVLKDESFSTADNFESVTQTTPNQTFDFRAELDMTNVKAALTAALASFSSYDPALYVLSGEFDIKITYPNTVNFDASGMEAKIGTLALTDFDQISNIYNVVSSSLDATDPAKKVVTIKLQLNDGVTVRSLVDDPTLLTDIAFQVDDVSITEYGSYPVEVSLTGSSVVKKNEPGANDIVATKQEYTGVNTATAGIYAPAPSGGGGSAFTITVNADKKSGTYPAGTEIELSSNVKNAVIYYTTDGTEPEFDEKGNPKDTTKIYENPIVINDDVQIKTVAVTSNFKTKSNAKTYDYKVEGVDISVIPESGTVQSGQEITLSSKKGDKIYYTLDGTEPTFGRDGNPTGSTVLYEKPFAILNNTTVKAIAVDENGVTSIIADETYVVAHGLITEHIAYIQGDDLGSFNPETPVTRAEIATIFSRITIKKMNVDYSAETSFSDVSEDDWFATAVAFMENAGIVNGYEDGTFRPNNYITRAEFATIASRYDRLTSTQDKSFTDVLASHWAYKNINSAAEHGWVQGYEDGTFRPDENIKRTETVTIVNRMLGRKANEEFGGKSTEGLIMFPDNLPTHWAYYEVIESSNTHDAP